MSAQAQTLAEQFEQANNDVIAAVEQCSDEEWRAACQAEGWPVAVAAHHIASSHEPIAGLVQTVANGQEPPPLTMETFDQMNAEHAKQFANCTKEETLQILRDGGKAAAAAVRGLSDEQLARSASVAGMPSMTAAQFIENVLIGHPRVHLASMKSAMGD